MTNVQRISSGVKANVEGGLAVVNHFSDLFFVSNLGNQATGYQFVIKFHIVVHPFDVIYSV